MKNVMAQSLRNLRHSQCGMTIIEMIGVLGVIGVLAAVILPKVFQVIAESKVEGLVKAAQTYEAAVTKYYSDVGTILPLNQAGIPQVENSGNSNNPASLAARLTLSDSNNLVLTTNLWPKFKGPYLQMFDTQRPPEIGTSMYLPTSQAVSEKTPVTSQNMGWDLNGYDGLSDLKSGSYVVFLKLEGIGEEDFLMLDKIVDPLIGQNILQRTLRGRAKWDPANNGTLYLYLANR